MNIKLDDQEKKGRAFVTEGEVTVAEMTYSKAGSHILIINHTEVNPALRGQNVGRQLLYKIVDYARTHELTVIPLCPFAKSVFDKDTSINDVLRDRN